MNRSTGASDEVPEEGFGQPLAGLAVAAGVGGDRVQTLVVPELLEPIDGVIARVVIGEDLREEDVQGDPRGVDPLPPVMAEATTGGLNEGAREGVEERESGLSCQAVSERVFGNLNSLARVGPTLPQCRFRDGSRLTITD